jgi:hypothetical protein
MLDVFCLFLECHPRGNGVIVFVWGPRTFLKNMGLNPIIQKRKPCQSSTIMFYLKVPQACWSYLLLCFFKKKKKEY